MTVWIVQALNGISLAMLLFLLAAGLSLIFGLMRIVNLAHGAYYLVGAYVGLSTIRHTGSFLLGAVAAFSAIALFGAFMYGFFLRYLHRDELAQVLLTFGFALMLGDLALWIWGGVPQTLPRPALLNFSVAVGPIRFPGYRLFVIAAGLLFGALLWYFQERTCLGALVRAAIDDAEMLRGLGVNTSVLFLSVFAAGAGIAAVGGVLGGPFFGVYPGADLQVLLLVLVVLIVGGLGSIPGAFVGSLLIGLIETLGKALFPELSMFLIYAPMVLILALKPSGLRGRA